MWEEYLAVSLYVRRITKSNFRDIWIAFWTTKFIPRLSIFINMQTHKQCLKFDYLDQYRQITSQVTYQICSERLLVLVTWPPLLISLVRLEYECFSNCKYCSQALFMFGTFNEMFIGLIFSADQLQVMVRIPEFQLLLHLDKHCDEHYPCCLV